MTTASPQSYGTGILFTLIATFGWSLSGLFVRFLPGLNGWQINCWRGFAMAVCLMVYLTWRYGRGVFAQFAAIPPLGLLLSAGFFATGSTMYVTALTLSSTATVSVFGTLAPLIAGLLSPWVTGDRPSVWSWTGAVLAVLGVLFIVQDGLAAGNVAGMAVALGYPVSFALQTLALRRYRAFDMIPALCAGGIASFLLAGAIGGGFNAPPEALPVIAAMGLLQMAIPIAFYAIGARSVPAITLSLVVLLDVVLNPLWSWIGAGEVPEITAIGGGAVIVVAVLLSVIGGNFARSRAAVSG